MMNLLFSPILIRIAWSLVHFLWEGALLGLLAWLTLFLLRREHPQVRYLVACGFLIASLLAPVFTYLSLAPASNPGWNSASASFQLLASWGSRIQSFLPWIIPLWLSGVLFLSLRTLAGWIWLQHLRMTAQPYRGELADCLHVFALEAGVRRQVRFLESIRVKSPMTMGVFRPIVILPLGFFMNLDPVAIDAVLAHELAHIRRFDVFVNGLQCIIETLLFFHPVVWWISRRIRAEREHCCDDSAVETCGDPILFAEALSQLDVLRTCEPILANSFRGGSLMERMHRLLGTDPSAIRIVAPSLSLALTFALGCSALLTRRETVMQRIAELPMQMAKASGTLLNRALVEGRGTVLGIKTWTPEHAITPQSFPPSSVRIAPSTVPDASVQSDSLGLQSPVPPDIKDVVPESTTSYSARCTGPIWTSLPEASEQNKNWVNWPASVSHMEASSLPFGSYSPFLSWHQPDVNAHRLFMLEVQPGEKLVFKLDGESSKITMEALLPSATSLPLPWRLAIQRANHPAHQRRAVRFEIQNPSSEPQPLGLMLYGSHGYSYRVELERFSANS